LGVFNIRIGEKVYRNMCNVVKNMKICVRTKLPNRAGVSRQIQISQTRVSKK